MIGEVLGRATGVVVTGAVGAAAYDGLRRLVDRRRVRAAAVGATAAGLRGVRAVEVGAERARLAAADIVSEARGRVGEQTPPPGGGAGHVHEH